MKCRIRRGAAALLTAFALALSSLAMSASSAQANVPPANGGHNPYRWVTLKTTHAYKFQKRCLDPSETGGPWVQFRAYNRTSHKQHWATAMFKPGHYSPYEKFKFPVPRHWVQAETMHKRRHSQFLAWLNGHRVFKKRRTVRCA